MRQPSEIKIGTEKLSTILRLHEKYLRGEDGGVCANLSNANLHYANLSYANLSNADLSNADLRNADLSNADLRYANLSDANLSDANLRNANLRNADLSNADLSNADLSNADLSYANLRDANLSDANLRNADLSNAQNISDLVLATLRITPETGEFTAWKKCNSNDGSVLVKLLIPADALRSNSTGRKCRASKAVVLEIQDMNGNKKPKSFAAVSKWDAAVTYKAGETITPDSWDENRWKECSHGIHFFLTRAEALDY